MNTSGMKSAKDIMSGGLVTVRETDTLDTVERVLDERGFGGLPVTDDGQKLVGMISRTDLMHHTLSHDDKTVAVRELMTPFIFSINPEDPIKKVVETMAKAGIHRVVVTEAGRPVGIITSMDLIKEFGRTLQ